MNLMRDREICVSSFIGTLGHSQPLISRHLAYLRNTGIVETRREGKWMHYSIASNLDDNTTRLLFELFKWMESQEGLRLDRKNYEEAYPDAVTPDPDAEPTQVRRMSTSARPRAAAITATSPKTKGVPTINQESFTVEDELHERETDERYNPEPEPEGQYDYESELEEPYNSISHHNELEDFLL